MPYAIRVRLYCGDVLEADTDPDLEPAAPGCEILPDLGAIPSAVAELAHGAHGPGARVMGFSEQVMDAYGALVRERARGATQFAYTHGYMVLERGSAASWKAQVDIHVAR